MNKAVSVAVGGVVVAGVVVGAFLFTRTGSEDSGGGATLSSSRAAGEALPTFGTQDAAAPAASSRPLEAAPLAPVAGAPGATQAAAAPAARPTGAPVTVSGRVVDPAGRPVAEARVTFVSDPFRVALGRGPFGSRVGAADDSPSVQTGRDGRFTIKGNLPAPSDERGMPLADAAPQLVVQHDVFATLVHPFEKLAAPGEDVGDLPLAAGAWITGRVVDDAARPLAGAHVTARNSDDHARSGSFMGPMFGGLAESLDQATTDAGGRFRVSGLLPGKADVTATAEGRRLAEVQDIDLQPGLAKDVGDITLPRGQTIGGLVVDGDGKAVVGAEVTVSSMARLMVNRIEDLPRGQIGQEFGQRSVTGPDGRFEIAGLAGGQYTVHVNADGFDRLSRDDVPAGTRDLRLVPARLGGLFVEMDSDGDGLPVKGARIKATPVIADVPWGRPDDPSQLLPVLVGQPALDAAGKTGDPAGAYFVQHAGLRGTKLVVAADGFATREVDGPAVDSAGLGSLTVRLVPESVVAGHVQRADGTPIVGAAVTLAAPRPDDGGNGMFRGPGRRGFRISSTVGGPPPNAELDAKRMTTQTLADGSFELRGAAPGDWELTATHPDNVDSPAQALTLKAGQSQKDLVVTLQPAGLVVGKVTEADGTPSSDIEVTVTPAATRAAADPQDVTASIGRMLRIDDGSGRRYARTEADGTYKVAGLAEGSYDVALGSSSRRGRSFGRSGMVFAIAGGGGDDSGQPTQSVKVMPGQETRADFMRPRRGSVTGRVIAGGRPVPDQPVSMRKGGQPGPMAFFGGGGDEERTDDRGVFTFSDVEAGEYDLSTQVPGAALEQKAHVKLEPGDARSADLVFGGSTISGKVLDKETNAGAGGVILTVTPVKEEAASGGGSGGGAQQMSFAIMTVGDGGGGPSGMTIDVGNGPAHVVRSDEKGEFQLLWVQPGKYRIEASGGGYTHAQTDVFEVADGQDKDDVRVPVQRGAIVQGSVVSGQTGEKLDSVPVRIEGPDSRQMTVTKNGSYRFEGLAAGSYTVTVLGSGFGDFGGGGGDSSLASEKVDLEQGQVKSLDLKTKT